MNVFGWEITPANIGFLFTGLTTGVTALSAIKRMRVDRDDSVAGGYRSLTESQGQAFDRVVKRLEQLEGRVTQLETEKQRLEQQLETEKQRREEQVDERDQRISDLESEVRRLKQINEESGTP